MIWRDRRGITVYLSLGGMAVKLEPALSPSTDAGMAGLVVMRPAQTDWRCLHGQ